METLCWILLWEQAGSDSDINLYCAQKLITLTNTAKYSTTEINLLSSTVFVSVGMITASQVQTKLSGRVGNKNVFI